MFYILYEQVTHKNANLAKKSFITIIPRNVNAVFVQHFFVSLPSDKKMKMKKIFILLAAVSLVVAVISCKKEKCQYYNDIMKYYDQSEEAWNLSCEQGKIDTVELHDQLYKIQREREALDRQYKDCVE